MPVKSNPKIALIGNPNAGKSSLFNQLTGLHQKVGNFPGVTVNKKTGTAQLDEYVKANILDLPGIYSLYGTSAEEQVALDVLNNTDSKYHPDILVFIADAANLKRSLLLFTQLKDLGLPVVLALNMQDMAKQAGTLVNPKALGALLQTRVIPINARTGEGLGELKFALTNTQKKQATPFFNVINLAPKPIMAIQERFPSLSAFGAYQVLLNGEKTNWLNPEDIQFINSLRKKYKTKPEALQAKETIARYQLIHELLAKTTRQRRANKFTQWLNRFDRLLTKPSWGYLFLLSLLFVVFQLVFWLGNLPMPLIDGAIGWLTTQINTILPNSWFGSLLLNALIPCIGSLLLFLPHLFIFFTAIALLEESGYLSRVMLLTDRAMRTFGLNGRSTIPMFSSAACSQPALLTQENEDSLYDKARHIFFSPLVNCQPRFPVYILLIGWFVPPIYLGGFISLQGLLLLGMMFFSLIVTVLTAWVLRAIRKNKPEDTFILELPYFTRPYWRDIWYIVWDNLRSFSRRILRIGLPVAIVLWGLTKIPVKTTDPADPPQSEYEISLGNWLEERINPVVAPLGFNGKIGLAIVCSFASREAFINYMATLNSLEHSDYRITVLQHSRLSQQKLTLSGLSTALSLLVFFAFAMQYFHMAGKLASQKAINWWAPLAQLIYMTALAYTAAAVVHSLLD